MISTRSPPRRHRWWRCWCRTGSPSLGWADQSIFWNEVTQNGVGPDQEVHDQPQVHTRWFRLDLDVTLGDAQVHETALIDGGLTPGRVVARSWGEEE